MRDIVCSFVKRRDCSLNSYAINLLRDRMIPFMYLSSRDVYARDPLGRWCKVEFEKLPPDPVRHPDTWRLELDKDNTLEVLP